MSIQQTAFVFKREGNQFKVAQDLLSDGDRCKVRKIASALQSIPAQHPEYDKISKCSELKITLFANSHPVIRIQNSENGLNAVFSQQTPVSTFESCTDEALSQLQKPAKVRELVKFVRELRKKDIAQDPTIQSSINLCMERLDELLTSDDSIVEKTLEEILAQKENLLTCTTLPILQEKLEQLYNDVKIALCRLEIGELSIKLKDREAELNNAKSAYRNATQSLTVRLKDLCGFLFLTFTPEDLQKELKINSENLKWHEKEFASLSEGLDQFEDFMQVRTPSEKKTKLTQFVSQFAGEAFFQDLLKLLDSYNKVSELLNEYKEAYFWKKPVLMGQIMSYGPSFASSFEQLQNKVPEKALGALAFLMGDSILPLLKEVFPVLQAFPDLRTELGSQTAMLKPLIAKEKTEIEKYRAKIQQFPLLIKIAEDRNKLKGLSPEAKEEILALENTEYQISGTVLDERKSWMIPENHPLEIRLKQLGKKEVQEAYKMYDHARQFYNTRCDILNDYRRRKKS